jgi:hypothetical protein
MCESYQSQLNHANLIGNSENANMTTTRTNRTISQKIPLRENVSGRVFATVVLLSGAVRAFISLARATPAVQHSQEYAVRRSQEYNDASCRAHLCIPRVCCRDRRLRQHGATARLGRHRAESSSAGAETVAHPPHTGSLGLAYSQEPALGPRFRRGMFVGQHGSWNRKPRSGYKVIFVPFSNGKPSGDPIDVLTGFVTENGDAMGRPVGVAVDRRGALLVADDVGNVIWRVSASLVSSAAR